MLRVGKQMSQRGLNALAFAVLGQHILHPVQRLDDAHGGPVGPIEAAGRSEFEVDLLATELDRLQPCVDQDLDARRDGGREAEIVGGRHAINERTRLVTTRNGSDDSTIVGHGGAAGQLVWAWSVVEATVNAAQLAGGGLIALVVLYAMGSLLHLRPLEIGNFRLVYPRPAITWRQLLAGPLELIGAAGIIYFALPDAANPGFLTVLGVFLASFSLALLSHAPGGLGVLEVTFLAALPEIPAADVLAALIVFRVFYLLLPFALSLLVVLGFEWSQWKERQRGSNLPS